jgi:hypothetical protein
MTRGHVESLERRRLLADIASLTLINAQTDQPLFALRNGAVIDLATTGKQLNILANVGTSLPPTWSVRFNYDGNPNYKMENVAPYAIGGDAMGGTDFLPWTPTLGTHTLIVTPYDKVSGTGTRGGGKMLTFEVIDSAQSLAAAMNGGPSLIADPLRVNAAGPAYTDKAGNLFAADIGFSASVKSVSTYAVGNTLDDPLYHSRRYAKNFSFSRPVASGVYTLKLHFAEPTFVASGKRVFDVSAEGQLVLDNLDLFKTAGAKKALVRSFEVTVNDGKIDVALAASVNNAIISAIELVPGAQSPPPPPPAPTIAVPAPVYIDAGSDAQFTDSVGRVFQPDSYFSGGAKGQASGSVANTDDDALFHTFRAGTSFTFSKSVANGRYTLFLEFADPQSTAVGQRKFDIVAEGVLALDDFDIFAEAPLTIFEPDATFAAVAKRIDVNVTDNKLDLAFTGVVGDALISAIALVPTDIPQFMIPYAGISDYSDPVLHEAVMTAYKIKSQSFLRQIGQGILLYSNEHRGGVYPPDLKTLALEQDLELHVFANPRVPVLPPRGQTTRLEIAAFAETQREYIYVGKGLRNTADATDYVAYENPDIIPSDKLSVLWGDGHVSEVPRSQVIEKFGGSPNIPSPLPRPTPSFGDQRIVESQMRLRRISNAMHLWANEHQGKFPPDMGSLYLACKNSVTYRLSPTDFINPRTKTAPPPAGATDAEIVAWINGSTDYIFAAPNVRESRATVVVYENPAEMNDGINILTAYGAVEYREMRWALETLVGVKAAGVA